MNTTSPEINLPVIAHDVSYDELEDLKQREIQDGLIKLLWTRKSGVDITYIDIRYKGREPVLVQVAPETANDALEDPVGYAVTAGYPVEEFFGPHIRAGL